MRPLTAVLVHGAFIADPGWWWRPLTSALEAEGIETLAVSLPSCGDPPSGDLHADSEAVRFALESVGGPTVLVAHSYGGMPATAVGGKVGDVRHILYVAAVVPDAHSSVLTSDWVSADSGEVVDVDVRPDGTVGEFPDKFAARLLGAVSESTREEAKQRLTRQAISAYGQEPGGAAWRTVPSTYLVCREDGDVAPAVQRRQAARAGAHAVELDTNHFPHLERPDLVVEVLLRLAATSVAKP